MLALNLVRRFGCSKPPFSRYEIAPHRKLARTHVNNFPITVSRLETRGNFCQRISLYIQEKSLASRLKPCLLVTGKMSAPGPNYGSLLGILRWSLAHDDGTAPSSHQPMSEEVCISFSRLIPGHPLSPSPPKQTALVGNNTPTRPGDFILLCCVHCAESALAHECIRVDGC